jgi:uncharacterized protein YegL
VTVSDESIAPPRSLVRAVPQRTLRFVYILDCSGSMRADGKIQALNIAIGDSIALLRAATEDLPSVRVELQVVRYADGAEWHIETPTPLADVRWRPVQAADGFSDLGAALRLVTASLRSIDPAAPLLPPVLVLLADGQATDDFRPALQALTAEALGAQALRLAVAIGKDADLGLLQEFIGTDSRYTPVRAGEPEAIVDAVEWVVSAASRLTTGTLRIREFDDPDIFRFEDEPDR